MLISICMRGCGCGGHPAFPAPSVPEGGTLKAKLSQNTRRDREGVPANGALFESRFPRVGKGAFAPCPPWRCEVKWWARLRFAQPYAIPHEPFANFAKASA